PPRPRRGLDEERLRGLPAGPARRDVARLRAVCGAGRRITTVCRCNYGKPDTAARFPRRTRAPHDVLIMGSACPSAYRGETTARSPRSREQPEVSDCLAGVLRSGPRWPGLVRLRCR